MNDDSQEDEEQQFQIQHRGLSIAMKLTVSQYSMSTTREVLIDFHEIPETPVNLLSLVEQLKEVLER